MTPDLEKLEKMAERATPGPWTVDAQDFVADLHGNDIVETLCGNYGNNAAYIACVSPDVTLALIAEIRRLELEAQWLAARLEHVCSETDGCPELGGDMNCCMDCGLMDVRLWRKAASSAVEAPHA